MATSTYGTLSGQNMGELISRFRAINATIYLLFSKLLIFIQNKSRGTVIFNKNQTIFSPIFPFKPPTKCIISFLGQNAPEKSTFFNVSFNFFFTVKAKKYSVRIEIYKISQIDPKSLSFENKQSS